MSDIDSLLAPLIDKARRMPCTDEAAYLAAWKAHALPFADSPLPENITTLPQPSTSCSRLCSASSLLQ